MLFVGHRASSGRAPRRRAPAAARPTLSGQLAGTLPAGQYDVTGGVWVAAEDTLRILAPADLAFYATPSFTINGRRADGKLILLK